ncbi:unknown [Coprococcus sp. CAG:782]|nr:unknown [Coprococcus sp. CAG:782]
MENIIYNDFLRRGYNVNVGVSYEPYLAFVTGYLGEIP